MSVSVFADATKHNPQPAKSEFGLPATHVAVLAGNSRLAIAADSSVVIEAQLKAFDAALQFAGEMRSHSGTLPPISVAFDHHGVFRQHYVAANLTNSQRRNPRLSHLRAEIVDAFTPIAQRHGIPLDAILAIHEDSARTHLEHVLRTENVSPAVRHRMVIDKGTDEKSNTEVDPIRGTRGHAN